MYGFSKGMIHKIKHHKYINKVIIGMGSIILMTILALAIFVQKAQADKVLLLVKNKALPLHSIQ